MFEKEAEEIAKDIYIHHFDDDVNYPDVLKAITVGVQKGAEHGYNKANEWYKVADVDLPSEEGGWVCNQDGLPCYFDWGTEQWLDCEGTQIRTTEWCHMPHKE